MPKSPSPAILAQCLGRKFFPFRPKKRAGADLSIFGDFRRERKNSILGFFGLITPWLSQESISGLILKPFEECRAPRKMRRGGAAGPFPKKRSALAKIGLRKWNWHAKITLSSNFGPISQEKFFSVSAKKTRRRGPVDFWRFSARTEKFHFVFFGTYYTITK